MKTFTAGIHVFASSVSAEKFKTAGAVAVFVTTRLLISGECLAQKLAGDSSSQGKAVSRPQLEPKSENASRPVTPSAGVNQATGRLERRVFVRSASLFVRAAVVEDKLLKRPEFQQLGFIITREEAEADLILELRHDLFTMYVFTVVDAKSRIVLAGGKLSSLGGTVAGKVAKRFVKEMAIPRVP